MEVYVKGLINTYCFNCNTNTNVIQLCRRQSDNTVKTVHVILFGDYEVLAHLYGLSGASGMFCAPLELW